MPGDGYLNRVWLFKIAVKACRPSARVSSRIPRVRLVTATVVPLEFHPLSLFSSLGR